MNILLAMFISPFLVVYKLMEAAVYLSWSSLKATWKIWVWYWRRGRKQSATHGNAAYADDKTLKAKGHFQNRGFLACITKSGKKVYGHFERALLMLAPPGTGKSQHLMAHIRAVLQREPGKLPHLILGDAANEFYRNLSDEMRAAGYQIFKIDLVKPNEGARYDVLADLDPTVHGTDDDDDGSFDTQLDGICSGMVTEEPNSRNPHFSNFARLLLRCVITANVKHGKNDKPICDLIDELLNEKDREAILKWVSHSGDKYLISTLETMQKMAASKQGGEGISMMSTSLQKLASWNAKSVRIVSRNAVKPGATYTRGWRMKDLLANEKPVALFIRTGMQTTAGDYARMVYNNAINAVAKHYEDTDQPLARELELIMDEAGLTGNCTAIVHAFKRLRKVGVRIRMCFLSLDEFQKTYPEWETLLAGSDILAFGGSNELKLNKLVSDLPGDYTIQNRSHSESDNGESKGYSEQARRLTKLDEVRNLEPLETIALLGNMTVKGKVPWRFNKKTGKPESL